MRRPNVLARTMTVATLAVFLTCWPCAAAKFETMTNEELAENPSVITIVNVAKVDKIQLKTEFWQYSQKVTAKVERCLKGDATGTIEVYVLEGVPVLDKGRYMLFISKGGRFWTVCGHSQGIRPIKNGQCLPYGSSSLAKPGAMSLEKFEGMIKGHLNLLSAAQSWVTTLLQGNVDNLHKKAETPFCLLNEMITSDAELKAGLEKIVKSKKIEKINKLRANGVLSGTEVRSLSGEHAKFVAGRSFKSLTTGGLKLIRIRLQGEINGRRGGFDFVVVIKPGKEPRVVGFGND